MLGQWEQKTQICGCSVGRECVYNPFSTVPEPTIHPLSAHSFPFGSTLKDDSMDAESVKCLSKSRPVSPLTQSPLCTASTARLSKMTKRSAHFSCTTAAFSHDKTTKKMNYGVTLHFLWLPQLMWLESLGLAGSLFRSSSVNDRLEIQNPTTTANTIRCHFCETTQLG